MAASSNANTASGGEARRQPRCRLSVDVLIRVTRNGRPKIMTGRSLEVTTVGMSATCDGELFPGEVVIVAFGSAMGPGLNLRAMVLNRNHTRCGFKFFRLTNDEREQLRRMVVSAS